MEYRHLAVAAEPPFVEIRMRRPERRNALSEEHLGELLHAVRAAGAGDAHQLLRRVQIKLAMETLNERL